MFDAVAFFAGFSFGIASVIIYSTIDSAIQNDRIIFALLFQWNGKGKNDFLKYESKINIFDF